MGSGYLTCNAAVFQYTFLFFTLSSSRLLCWLFISVWGLKAHAVTRLYCLMGYHLNDLINAGRRQFRLCATQTIRPHWLKTAPNVVFVYLIFCPFFIILRATAKYCEEDTFSLISNALLLHINALQWLVIANLLFLSWQLIGPTAQGPFKLT
jgi:hypothetical protein